MTKQNRKILAFLCFFLGLVILVYPFLSDHYRQKKQDTRITRYDAEVTQMSQPDLLEAWKSAERYNQVLGGILIGNAFNSALITEINQNYENLLNIGGDGMMGYISIPKISILLPVFHEASTHGAGHMMNTSLPVGGMNTHSVLVAHSGLRSSRQFTDLTAMEVGDYFALHIMEQVLYYRVDQILVVEPENTSDLMIQQGKDFVTLLTCTPYGVNSHRLLVRGVRADGNDPRIQNEFHSKDNSISTWYVRYWKQLVLSFFMVTVLTVLLILELKSKKRRVLKAVGIFALLLVYMCNWGIKKIRGKKHYWKKKR